MPKAILIDTTRCTACRGCQVGCKEWKNFPAVPTKQQGSHQNPPDLTQYNFKLVRFSEHLDGDTVQWYFFPDACRHCVDAPCKNVSTVEGAIVQDKATGAILYTEKTAKEDFKTIKDSCPYDIPRQDPKTKQIVKCDMCIDRVQANLLPMCVKSCAMGAMSFGERADILKQAGERLEAVKKEFPKASLLNKDDVSVIYLVADTPAKYHKFAVADASDADPRMSRKDMLAGAVAPLRKLFDSLQG
ncbi:Formate dehydrogenase 2 subunit beta (cytochrome c-553) [Fundidesulfovibrio magnetotacticus]|uniref:Formate dehydrogenase 2 subunit beta (Cytochrome c-553) n=1 Tax=Fundidesulfovibrio magnetotacticus TaxID=2730080 RepID=A0A6V8LWN1_9BACT|nr:4Fe-4S dicluster domain-containing protein [Fundidesulfovibrio magnetotacticus]GFK92685.1 Formate dehydrogenase 2 subunit beta (cytochrome c-553) [Fundidesulfovibrio magnetotacticus]